MSQESYNRNAKDKPDNTELIQKRDEVCKLLESHLKANLKSDEASHLPLKRDRKSTMITSEKKVSDQADQPPPSPTLGAKAPSVCNLNILAGSTADANPVDFEGPLTRKRSFLTKEGNRRASINELAAKRQCLPGKVGRSPALVPYDKLEQMEHKQPSVPSEKGKAFPESMIQTPVTERSGTRSQAKKNAQLLSPQKSESKSTSRKKGFEMQSQATESHRQDSVDSLPVVKGTPVEQSIASTPRLKAPANKGSSKDIMAVPEPPVVVDVKPFVRPPLQAERRYNKTTQASIVGKSSGRWTKPEHQRFIEAIKLYGKSWKHVEDHIGTRTSAQIRSHAQKYFQKVEKSLGREPTDQELMDFEEVLSDDLNEESKTRPASVTSKKPIKNKNAGFIPFAEQKLKGDSNPVKATPTGSKYKFQSNPLPKKVWPTPEQIEAIEKKMEQEREQPLRRSQRASSLRKGVYSNTSHKLDSAKAVFQDAKIRFENIVRDKERALKEFFVGEQPLVNQAKVTHLKLSNLYSDVRRLNQTVEQATQIIIQHQNDASANICEEEERLLERIMIFIADLNNMRKVTKQIFQAQDVLSVLKQISYSSQLPEDLQSQIPSSAKRQPEVINEQPFKNTMYAYAPNTSLRPIHSGQRQSEPQLGFFGSGAATPSLKENPKRPLFIDTTHKNFSFAESAPKSGFMTPTQSGSLLGQLKKTLSSKLRKEDQTDAEMSPTTLKKQLEQVSINLRSGALQGLLPSPIARHLGAKSSVPNILKPQSNVFGFTSKDSSPRSIAGHNSVFASKVEPQQAPKKKPMKSAFSRFKGSK